MKPNKLSSITLYVLSASTLMWGVISANSMVYSALARSSHNIFVNDIFSDVVLLCAAFLPAIWAPGFFGYRISSTRKHWKMLLSMAIFFSAAPLVYRLLAGETPFGANTWFFEGIIVPLAEEGFFRGVLLSILLWGFGKIYPAGVAATLTVIFSALIFASAHLSNLGNYPTGFILFQVVFSTLLGLALSFTRVKTGSIYPALFLHALFNLAGTH